MNITEIFWNSSVEEIKKGYADKDKSFICLICGKDFEKGIIYPDNGIFFEAEKYVKYHLLKEHESVFSFLLSLDKKYTGLTDLQKKLLNYFYKGLNDQEIIKLEEGGNSSTIRNHRFSLREREKQAKVFLSIMEILKEKSTIDDEFIEIHRTANMIDDRYRITEEENAKVLKSQFKDGIEGKLSNFPKKQKQKLIVLRSIINRFEVNKKYTEKEVNEVLKNLYDDYVTLRRYLIEYGFMDRTTDCSSYWVKV
jgi:hypothetical protein